MRITNDSESITNDLITNYELRDAYFIGIVQSSSFVIESFVIRNSPYLINVISPLKK